jgi:hypothetical protein
VFPGTPNATPQRRRRLAPLAVLVQDPRGTQAFREQDKKWCAHVAAAGVRWHVEDERRSVNCDSAPSNLERDGWHTVDRLQCTTSSYRRVPVPRSEETKQMLQVGQQ